MLNSYSGILFAFVLVVGAIIFGAISIAWSIRPRKVELGLQKSIDGSTHVIPGEGHVKDWDCMCRPEVYREPGVPPVVEHRPLPVLQRGDCS